MPVTTAPNYTKMGDSVLNSLEKTNSELLALMYGSLVTQVLKDVEDINSANSELEKLGQETGVRLIEDFMAKTQLQACSDFRETCEVIAKVAFRIFLGVVGEVAPPQNPPNPSVCFITLPLNPLAEFVDLPPSLSGLQYNAYICGVIAGALEQVHLKVKVSITKDVLTGADVNEFKLELIEILKDVFFDLEDV